MADDDMLGLYDGLDSGPRLPSVVELGKSLATAVGEREALEAQLHELKAQEAATRASIKDLTRRACILLATARSELKRKESALEELRALPNSKRQRAQPSKHLPVADQHQLRR